VNSNESYHFTQSNFSSDDSTWIFALAEKLINPINVVVVTALAFIAGCGYSC
jgi:hypothetical protein